MQVPDRLVLEDAHHLDDEQLETRLRSAPAGEIVSIRYPPQHQNHSPRTAAPQDEMPYRWSQRRHDDPPIGTIVLGNERVIYTGNGEWQPLTDEPNSSRDGRPAAPSR